MLYLTGDSNSEIGQLIGRWYSDNVQRPLYAPYGAIGFFNKNNEIQGAAILESYNGSNVNLHVYAPRCVTKQNIKIILNQVFNVLKCNRLTAIIRRSNKKSLDVLPRLHFSYECTLVGYFGPKKENDGIVFRMMRKQASNWIDING